MKRKHLLKSEKGMATLETVPLMLIFVLLMSYTLGGFGIVHTGIMNSISARAYAFETFRNRTNVSYFRDSPGGSGFEHYRAVGSRAHGIMHERMPGPVNTYWPTERALRMGVAINPGPGRTDEALHNERIPAAETLSQNRGRNTQFEASPVWIMIQYGICINTACGGGPE